MRATVDTGNSKFHQGSLRRFGKSKASGLGSVYGTSSRRCSRFKR